MKNTLFMFSGQGSQYFQMGRELFESNQTFKKSMTEFEGLIRELTSLSILDVIYGNQTFDDFDDITLTHPSLYAIQLSLVNVLANRGIYPSAVLGYSLGEYVAAAVSGVYSKEAGLELLIHQSSVLSKQSLTGSMMVILGSIEQLESEGLLSKVSVSGENYDGNFIVSGRVEDVSTLRQVLKSRYIYCELLPIKYPFHSELMDPYKDQLLEYARTIEFNAPSLPFYSCVEGRRISNISAEHMWRVIRYPILFQQTVKCASSESDASLVDLGPSGSLAGTIRQFAWQPASVHKTINQFGSDIKEIEGLVSNLGN